MSINMNRNKHLLSLLTIGLIFFGTIFITSCSNISYKNPAASDTTTIQYNGSDIQTTTASMIDQMLQSPRLQNNLFSNTKLPIVAPSVIANDTDEHINTQILSDAITTKMLNSNKFDLVDMNALAAIKKQQKFQNNSGMVNQETAVEEGRLVGAQYILYGTIANIKQQNSSQIVNFFQITLKLISIETGKVVWQGQKLYRKDQSRSWF